MEVIRCDASSEEAQEAFKLRYEVFAAEYGVSYDPNMNHQDKIYIDQFDQYAKIYVVISEGRAIATSRTLYDRDYDFNLLPEFYKILGLNNFLTTHKGTLAVSSKIAVAPDQRGSLATPLITSRSFKDAVDDGINFLFSACAPGLLHFYSKLGFQMYTQPRSTEIGLQTPIVLSIKDLQYLRNIHSPLLNEIQPDKMVSQDDSSVKWFYENYGQLLQSFVSNYDSEILDRLHKNIGNSDKHIFNGIPLKEIEKLISSNKIIHLLPGDYITKSNDISNVFFIVIEGNIEVTNDIDESSAEILGPGDIFAETSMLSRKKVSANYKAASKVTLAVAGKRDIERIIKSDPELAARILYNLSTFLSTKCASIT